MHSSTPILSGSPSSQSPNNCSPQSVEDFRRQVKADLACLDYLFGPGPGPDPARASPVMRSPMLDITSSPLRSQASSPPGSPFTSSPGMMRPSYPFASSPERRRKRKLTIATSRVSHDFNFGPSLDEVVSGPRFRIPQYGKKDDYGNQSNKSSKNYEGKDDDDDDATTISTSIPSDMESPGGFNSYGESTTTTAAARHCSTAYLHYQGCGCRYTVTHNADARASDACRGEGNNHQSMPLSSSTPKSQAASPLTVSRPVSPTDKGIRTTTRSKSSSSSATSWSSGQAPSCDESVSSSEPGCLQAMIAELANLANPPHLYTATGTNETNDETMRKQNILSSTSSSYHWHTDGTRSKKRRAMEAATMTTHSLPGICNTCRLFEESLPTESTAVSRPPRRGTGDTTTTAVPTLVPTAPSDPQSSSSSSEPWSRRPSYKSAVEHLAPPMMGDSLHAGNSAKGLIINSTTGISNGDADDLYDGNTEGGVDGHRLAELLAVEQQRIRKASLAEPELSDAEAYVDARESRRPSAVSMKRKYSGSTVGTKGLHADISVGAGNEGVKLPQRNVWRATRDLAAMVHSFVLTDEAERGLRGEEMSFRQRYGDCADDDNDDGDYDSSISGSGSSSSSISWDPMYDADDEGFSHSRSLVPPALQPSKPRPSSSSVIVPINNKGDDSPGNSSPYSNSKTVQRRQRRRRRRQRATRKACGGDMSGNETRRSLSPLSGSDSSPTRADAKDAGLAECERWWSMQRQWEHAIRGCNETAPLTPAAAAWCADEVLPKAKIPPLMGWD